jgi:peptide-O-fucosyltransferase
VFQVVVLQKLKDAFADGGTWIETAVEENCRVKLRYQLNSDKLWEGQFFGYEHVRARKLTCLSVQGRISVLKSELIRMAKYTRSFLVENFEQLLHEEFGSVDYWKARRSMVYVGELRQVGNQFMIDELDYNPGDGVGRSRPNDGGGAYLSVHLRRQDYARAKPHQVPSLEGVASQIKILKKEQKLKAVFIATDAPLSEKRQLKKLIGGKVVWLDPSDELIGRHGDGGVAIIDQWIAAHSKYFVGTIESTFSFRIREDRQFMKFPIEDTFNDLCGPTNDEFDPHSCPTPSKWLLVEDQSHDEL